MRSRTIFVVTLAIAGAGAWAGTSTAVNGQSPVTPRPAGPYDVRCLQPWELRDTLNARSKAGWELDQMSPFECQVTVAGRAQRRAGFMVVLKR